MMKNVGKENRSHRLMDRIGGFEPSDASSTLAESSK